MTLFSWWSWWSNRAARHGRRQVGRPRRSVSRLRLEQLESRDLPSANLVADIMPGSADSFPSQLTDVSGTLFFTSHGALWKSDGTTAGTVQLASFDSAPAALTDV